jgi:hypothetical protein
VEAVFVLRAQRGPGGGVKLKGQSAGNQRQNTERYIYHDFPDSNRDAIGARPLGCKTVESRKRPRL